MAMNFMPVAVVEALEAKGVRVQTQDAVGLQKAQVGAQAAPSSSSASAAGNCGGSTARAAAEGALHGGHLRGNRADAVKGGCQADLVVGRQLSNSEEVLLVDQRAISVQDVQRRDDHHGRTPRTDLPKKAYAA
eukprot:CAMPEP_0203862800 /NCGR_PEP_ID=MMETSP0359-20131031/13800_1 /ASSEMBLY_ACC=CAM_ASM_000338 /TAXON_ID=268821 /ORGANISM="Scrippsiella Hangoei, Strain SHTV-5" /LENGTH=132 /DNA_ID=CAMNT_0050780247 /DNA_START=171 /DNA_END=565 /DNA_ORIENTATION=+